MKFIESFLERENVVATLQSSDRSDKSETKSVIMERWVGKIAVVTGSSSGIGLATSIALVRQGMIVIGMARRKALMEQGVAAATKGAKGKFHGYECDVSNEQSVIDNFRSIKKIFGTVDVLVNNAGIAIPGTISETTSEMWQKTFGVNVMGLLYCTQQAVKLMKESKLEGHVIMINSIQGHRVHTFPDFNMNIYPASKHAVTAITETLQKENLGDKIRFTSLSPGYVKTEITETHNFPSSLKSLPHLESEDVANAIVYAIGTPQRVQIAELTIRPLGERTS